MFPRHPTPPPRGVSPFSHGPQLSWKATLAWPCALALPLPACQRPRSIRFLSCSLLQFLRASLETIGDDAWIKRLSCVLSQRLDSSPSSSGEKVGSLPGSPLAAQPRGPRPRAGLGLGLQAVLCPRGLSALLPRPLPPAAFPSSRAERGWRKPIPASGLGCSPCAGPVAARQAVAASRARLVPLQAFLYKALGTTLAACQELPHVQENLLQHLTRAQPEEPSEAQVSFPALSLGPAPGLFQLLIAARHCGWP